MAFILRLSPSTHASPRFEALRALYPRATVEYALVHDELSLCVIQATIARYPGDPAPAIAHASSALAHNTEVEWRWTCNIQDVRDAALARACQNLYLPVALEEGVAPAELWKAQHAAFAWLWHRAGKEREWHPDRVAAYRHLADTLGFPDDLHATRYQEVMEAPEPRPAVMQALVEFFGGRADAMQRLVDLPLHLMPRHTDLVGKVSPEAPPQALELKRALFARFPNATIQTKCSRLRDGSVVMQAAVSLEEGLVRVGGGFEVVFRGKGPSLLNLASVEVCETRAIADVLMKLGVRREDASAVPVLAAAGTIRRLLEAASNDPAGHAAIEARATREGFTPQQVARLLVHYQSHAVLPAPLTVFLASESPQLAVVSAVVSAA